MDLIFCFFLHPWVQSSNPPEGKISVVTGLRSFFTGSSICTEVTCSIYCKQWPCQISSLVSAGVDLDGPFPNYF